MPTVDMEKIARSLYSNDKARGQICEDFELDAPGSPEELECRLIEALGQTPPPGRSWEAPVDNDKVFRAAVRAIGSNSRPWARFLEKEDELRDLLDGYRPAEMRERLRSDRAALEEEIKHCLTGLTGSSDARAVLAWAELLGTGVAYYDSLVDLHRNVRRRIADEPGVREADAVPMVAAILGNRSRTMDRRWPPPPTLASWKAPGMRFVLACEFLRNLYWDGFKPDRHIKRLFSRWFPDLAAASEAKAARLAEIVGSRNKELIANLKFALVGMAVTPEDRRFNEVDNLVWALGRYVEKKGKESDTDYTR